MKARPSVKHTSNIVLTEQDWLRLEKLLTHVPKTSNVEWLQEEIDRAEVVPPHTLPPNIVTMHSRVRFLDRTTGKESEVTLVYPKEADVQQGKISVLAPVGSALLGLSEGQTIEWEMPGEKRTLEVCKVLYQPENDLLKTG